MSLQDLAPPHVLWQVSFGCWVTWSISSWQKCYKSVFFFNFTKLQFLNNKTYSYTKNNYLALGNQCFGQFHHSRILGNCSAFDQFLLRENLRGLIEKLKHKIRSKEMSEILLKIEDAKDDSDSQARKIFGRTDPTYMWFSSNKTKKKSYLLGTLQ